MRVAQRRRHRRVPRTARHEKDLAAFPVRSQEVRRRRLGTGEDRGHDQCTDRGAKGCEYEYERDAPASAKHGGHAGNLRRKARPWGAPMPVTCGESRPADLRQRDGGAYIAIGPGDASVKRAGCGGVQIKHLSSTRVILYTLASRRTSPDFTTSWNNCFDRARSRDRFHPPNIISSKVTTSP